MGPKVVTKLHRDGVPESGRIHQPRSLNQWTTMSFGALQLSTLNRILKDAERGELEDYADLVEYILTTDPHVRSVYETRMQPVAGGDFEVEPGVGAKGSESIADAAAELIRNELDRQPDIQRTFGDLLHAVGLGWSALEHKWFRQGNRWRSEPQWIHPRDIRFDKAWKPVIRTWVDGSIQKWINTKDHPHKFIVHLPRSMNCSPTKSGLINVVAWIWLFKRWQEKFRNAASERYGTPKTIATMPEGSPGDAKQNMLDAMNALSFDHQAIVDFGTTVEVFEAARDASLGLNAVIDHMNAEISKAYLGSTLNVEVGNTGGNRALGESQFDTTILPRLMGDATRLANTLERDWFVPLLEFNSHLFGGLVPPTPQLRFVLVSDDPPEVDQVIVDSRAVTVNEIRQSRGLEPWTAEQGGEQVIVAKEPIDVADIAEEAVGEGASDDIDMGGFVGGFTGGGTETSPKAFKQGQQMDLPLGNLRIPSASQTTPLGLALEGLSGTLDS